LEKGHSEIERCRRRLARKISMERRRRGKKLSALGEGTKLNKHV
jgi:hypothetical protein